MKRYKIIISLAAIICGLMIACDNTDYSNKAPFDNMVYIKEASNSNSERVTFRNTLNEQKRAFSAKLTYPAGKDIVVKLKADPGLINEFNARHGTDYGMLDSKYYSLSNSELIIKAEKSESLIDTIYFNNLLDLEIDKTYLVPLTISETSGGVHLLNGSKTLFYLVRRSSAITVAANLKDNYLEVPTFLDEEKNACLKELGQITMEALVYVEDFTYSGPSNTAGASDISTIMGVEQHFLMRIGDTSFPRQQLQMQGPDGVKFPAADRAKSLNAMTWYHIALVYNAKEHFIAYYVNGQLQSQDISYGKGATVDICGTPDCEFQIGRLMKMSYGNSTVTSQKYVSGTLAVRKRKSGRICIKWKILKTKKACLLTGNLMKVRETLSRTIRNTDSMQYLPNLLCGRRESKFHKSTSNHSL